MITGIVAAAKDLAIGKDGKLPWHYSADLKFFKRTTTGNAIVMGSRTWHSLGKPLPNRLNIVLSRSEIIDPQAGVMVMRSKEEVLTLAAYLKGDLFIIGGAKTFETFADAIEKWVVTEIPIAVPDADVCLPQNVFDDFEQDGEEDLGDGLLVKTFLKK